MSQHESRLFYRQIPKEAGILLAGVALGVAHNVLCDPEAVSTKITQLDDIAGALLRRIATLSGDEQSDLNRYSELLNATTHWHGTGRYYTSHVGESVDVLSGILAATKLLPAPDITDHNNGLMHIVAASPNRMHARIYADIHAFKPNGADLYGSTSFWSGVFAGRIVHNMLIDGSFKAFVSYTLKNAIRTRRLRQPRVQKESVMSAQGLLRGSKIAENYPLLIGIASPAATLGHKHRHEVRYPEVSISQFTHIQVPRVNVPEVEARIEEYGHQVPVLPLEVAEMFAAQVPFSQLID